MTKVLSTNATEYSRALLKEIAGGSVQSFRHAPFVCACPANQHRARGFAEGETEFDVGHALHQRFVNILDGFDEVALAQDKINPTSRIGKQKKS